MTDIPVPALSALSHVPALTNPVILSDLNLDLSRPKTLMGFLRFMKTIALRHAELVILGDLFLHWYGDDLMADDDPVAAEFKLLTSTGRRVLIMRGEHDILLGRAFAEKSGAELIDDPIVIETCGRPILYSHGADWCVGDKARADWRAQMKDPDVQKAVLALPPAEREAEINAIRQACILACEARGEPVGGTEKIYERAAAEAARTAAVNLVMHGHTLHPGANINAAIERWCCPNWDLDQPAGSARHGYISFRENARPQIQML